MSRSGAFTFVLHCHMPYSRQVGGWPHGEAWLHEAMAETYVPLLNTLYDLHAQGTPARLTVDLTPILCEQLADPTVKANFSLYLDERIARAETDGQRLQAEGLTNRASLAEWYRDWYRTIQESYEARYSRDLVGAFRRLQSLGVLELVTSAATHAYLPLLSTVENVRAQLRVAVAAHQRHFGRAPRGIWLPECAYRPGLEEEMALENLRLFFAESQVVVQGEKVGWAAGDALSNDGTVKHNYSIPYAAPSAPATTCFPYYAGARGRAIHSGVVVLGRNDRTGLQVWNSDFGYPGNKDYREFHKRAEFSGLQYWRVTDLAGDLGAKEEWHPTWAILRAGEHAHHFAALVEELVAACAKETGRYGLVCAAYDAELFGHWWFEGVDWLREVLQLLADSPSVELTTACEFAEQHPPVEVLALPAGSWGQGGSDAAWNNTETQPMWEQLHRAEWRMVAIAQQHAGRATVEAEPVLAQLARENLLLQSSDWPFLITAGQAHDYAAARFSAHLERFNTLAEGIERGALDVRFADECYARDKVFPDIDWRWWA